MENKNINSNIQKTENRKYLIEESKNAMTMIATVIKLKYKKNANKKKIISTSQPQRHR